MAKQLMKGNEAVVKGALAAGCQCYYGYPITPASEIAETASVLFPLLNRTFVQAESEIAAINMVYGSAAAGVRAMTASSGPGLSLKMEGISYCAGAELPCVIVDIVRGGPGLGNIAPEQSDYWQIVKNGGHGNYRVIVLAPNSCQEMADFGKLAFDIADKYRNPVIILTDGFIGQMMESVEVPAPVDYKDDKDWAVKANIETINNFITSIQLEPDDLEKHVKKLFEKYALVEKNEVRFQEYETEDADLILIGYGIVSRVLISVVYEARKKGLKVGLLRPITLYPFPFEKIRSFIGKAEKGFLVVEMSVGQMIEDVRLAVYDKAPINFYGRWGGNVPSTNEVLIKVLEIFERKN